MKHRDAADSKRYRMLAKKFIAKYGVDTDKYDVIKGWRANASYFYIAKEFVRDNIDMDILEELLSLGGLGIQYCIKSELAYSKLHEVADGLQTVEYTEFNEKYNHRDITARQKMRELVDTLNKASDAYYNGQQERMSDYEWDAAFDALKKLEEETGTVLEDSPTINVSSDDTQGLKEPHEFPALSLAKTKKVTDLVKWASDRDNLFINGNWMD